MFHPYPSNPSPMRFREKKNVKKGHFSVKKDLKILALRFKLLKFLKSITLNVFRFLVSLSPKYLHVPSLPLPHPSPHEISRKKFSKNTFFCEKRLGKILALRFKILKFLKSITFNDFRFFVTITTSPPPLPHPSPTPPPPHPHPIPTRFRNIFSKKGIFM